MMRKIGHRGAKAWSDENTIASIKKAIELGATEVEIDIHCCKTGELIVMHDHTISRTTNGKGKINEKTLEELKNLRTKNNHEIPTLEEVLKFCANKCHVHIELKGKKTATKTVALIEKLIQNKTTTYSQLTVSSFKLSKLKKIKHINSSINVGLIAHKNLKIKLKQCTKWNIPIFYPFHQKLNKKLVSKAHQSKIDVFCWTVNKKINILRMKKMGVDGIISDYPEKL